MLLSVLLAALACAGCGSGSDDPAAAASRLKVDRFDGRRAFAELRRQVELGPRPAGSKRLRRLAVRLREELPRGRFEAVPGHPGLRNIVGHLPGTKPAVVVAAHYDTKKLPGFVGANDGAGGTAAVMELARVLRRTKRPEGAPELRFVLFDGEEATNDRADFTLTGLRGSKAYARRHAAELGRSSCSTSSPTSGCGSGARRAPTRRCGRACARPRSGSARARRSRRARRGRSPTTTRRSWRPGSRRST